jgi:hypothetical protein
MVSARAWLAAAAALAPMAYAASGGRSALEPASFGAWAACAWIALASAPGDGRHAGSLVLALPILALGTAADLRVGAGKASSLAQAAIALALLAALLAAADAARERRRTGAALAAWVAIVAFAPCLELALRVGAGSPAPAAVEAWSSFSPLRWAAAALALEGQRGIAEAARGSAAGWLAAWRPAVSAAVLALLAWAPTPRPERGP